MTAWYRQFWPWFVIAIPAASVIAGALTVVIALDHEDALVRDDWYVRGQRINEELALDAAAADRHVSAVLAVAGDGRVVLELDVPGASYPAQLELELRHPTDAARDRRAVLRGDGRGRFAGAIEAQPQRGAQVLAEGRWDVLLRAPDGDWRLVSRVSLPAAGVRLQAGS